MKPKPLPKRNPFVVLALKRKAGSHRKPNKAIRRAEKVTLNGDEAQRQSVRRLTCRKTTDNDDVRAQVFRNRAGYQCENFVWRYGFVHCCSCCCFACRVKWAMRSSTWWMSPAFHRCTRQSSTSAQTTPF